MRVLQVFMLLLCFLQGCQKQEFITQDDCYGQESENSSKITFSVGLDADVETKGLLIGYFEYRVSNYNVYCFDTLSGELRRFYSSSSAEQSLWLDNGDWEIFVITNTYADLGDMTRDELYDYSLEFSSESDMLKNYSLVMVYHEIVNISSTQTLPIEVSYYVARFDIDIIFEGDAAGYSLKGTEIINAPSSCKLFQDNTSSSEGIGYDNFTNKYMGFYVPENLQGVNESITEPEDKNAQNAPEHATYIRLTIESDFKYLTYDYYLGGNEINDFNIRRNVNYQITITITGDDSSDMRITSSLKPYWISATNTDICWLKGLGAEHNWVIKFIAGDKQNIDITFYADLDNNETLFSYGAYLVTNTDYNSYLAGNMSAYDLMMSSLLRSSPDADDWVVLNNYQDYPYVNKAYATVESYVTYRILVRCLQAEGNPSSFNDFRVYMEEGTEVECYVDYQMYVIP